MAWGPGKGTFGGRVCPASTTLFVIAAKARIQGAQEKSGPRPLSRKPWAPASAGVTDRYALKKPFSLWLRLTSPSGNCYPAPLRFGFYVLTH